MRYERPFFDSGQHDCRLRPTAKTMESAIDESVSETLGEPTMKVIIEPDDGVAPLLSAIKKAKKSIELAVFRFDHSEIEAALKAAAAKGARVTALIAYSNRGGEKNLRKLEHRFLDAGIIVARSADDLIRYHDKFILIDRRILYLLSFNFTRADIDHSRGFGIETRNVKWVHEATKLFKADCTRTPYAPTSETFVVSPANSRRALGTFLKRAKRQLLIYDPKISDEEMLRILEERAKAGVEIRIIGKVSRDAHLTVRKMTTPVLHTRTIIRDRVEAFVGSQSLRSAELDSRRELGLIIRDATIVKKLVEIFETDWASKNDAEPQPLPKPLEAPVEAPAVVKEEQAKKAVQILAKQIHPLASAVKKVVKKAVDEAGGEVLRDKTVKSTMKKVVKKAVKVAVKEAVQESHDGEAAPTL